jgi:Cyclopropane fatty acid synthase and related methyltransferases
MKKYFDIGRHYDSITEGWRYILGENFHFGYFKTPDDDLNIATDNLIDELASLGKLGPETKILDAGCGIGNPAIYLHDKFGSDITGISISKKGVDLANRRIQGDKYKGKIRFMVSDMTSTDFPDKSFNVIWVLESSHLIKNKGLLFDECYRLLKPGGDILLADILVNKEFNLIFKLKNIFKLINLIKTFGKGKSETPEHYIDLLRKSGFKNIFSRNIGKEAEETLNGWWKNIIKNRSSLIKVLDEKGIKRFEKSIEDLKYFFGKGLNCYYLFKAEK